MRPCFMAPCHHESTHMGIVPYVLHEKGRDCLATKQWSNLTYTYALHVLWRGTWIVTLNIAAMYTTPRRMGALCVGYVHIMIECDALSLIHTLKSECMEFACSLICTLGYFGYGYYECMEFACGPTCTFCGNYGCY